MRASRYIALTLGTLAALGAAWMLAAASLLPPSAEARWVHDMMQTKHRAAAAAAGPRILVVGASGAHFGVDTNMIEAATGRPSINLGGHGGLGLAYMLREARRAARTGDTIILSIEYAVLDIDVTPPKLLREYVLHFDRSYLAQARWRDLPYFFFWSTPEDLLRAALIGPRPDDNLILGRFRLSADSIDARGNETINRADALDATILSRVAMAPRLAPARRPHRSVRMALAGFVAWARAAEVRVLATWPSMLADERYQEPAYLRYFSDRTALYAELGVPVLGTPQEAMLALPHMFDTIYHPNDVGRAARTRALVRRLCAEALPCKPSGADDAAARTQEPPA